MGEARASQGLGYIIFDKKGAIGQVLLSDKPGSSDPDKAIEEISQQAKLEGRFEESGVGRGPVAKTSVQKEQIP